MKTSDYLCTYPDILPDHHADIAVDGELLCNTHAAKILAVHLRAIADDANSFQQEMLFEAANLLEEARYE